MASCPCIMIGLLALIFEMSVVVIMDAAAMESSCWLTVASAVLDLVRNAAGPRPIFAFFTSR